MIVNYKSYIFLFFVKLSVFFERYANNYVRLYIEIYEDQVYN